MWDGQRFNTFLLYDQPVGIIGYGSIGRELHRLLQPFGVSVSVYDPWLGDGYLAAAGLRLRFSLEDLLSFVVQVHLRAGCAIIGKTGR